MKKYTVFTIMLILLIVIVIGCMSIYFLKKEEIKSKLVSDNIETNTEVAEKPKTETEIKVIKTVGTGSKRPSDYSYEIGYAAIYRGEVEENGLNQLVEELKDEELKDIIKDFVSTSKAKLENKIEDYNSYIENGNKNYEKIEYNGSYIDYYTKNNLYQESLYNDIKVEWECINGYLSISIYLPYYYGEVFNDNTAVINGWERNYGVYDAYCATFDLYTGKRLKFSDLFFEGEDYSTEVYEFMQSEISARNLNEYIKREFTTIDPDFENFTINYIYFTKTNKYFSEGAVIPINRCITMIPTITIPRDMEGVFNNSPEIVNTRFEFRGYTAQKTISGVPFKITKIKHWDDKVGEKINTNIEKYLKYLIDNNYFDKQIESENSGNSRRKAEKNTVSIFINDENINYNIYLGDIYPDYTIRINPKTGEVISTQISDLVIGVASEEEIESFRAVAEELKKL